MDLFAGPLESLDDTASEIEESAAVRITTPANMKPAIRDAFDKLERATSQLLRGNHRAAAEHAADAINIIRISEDLNVYASY